MINILFSGMCKDCKNADLEIWQEDRYEIGMGKNMEIMGGEWRVKCAHEEVCERWQEREREW